MSHWAHYYCLFVRLLMLTYTLKYTSYTQEMESIGQSVQRAIPCCNNLKKTSTTSREFTDSSRRAQRPTTATSAHQQQLSACNSI